MKFPADDQYFKWTTHIKQKMAFYRLSPQVVKTVLKNSVRREEGVAPQTIAVMKRNDTAKRKEEIWVMYRLADSARRSSESRVASTSKKRRKKNISDGMETVRRLKELLVPEKRIMISAWRYPGITKPGEQPPIPEDILQELQNES